MALQSNETLETESSVNILRSKLAPIDYPAVSMGEYLAGRIAKHPEDALAFLDPNNNYHLTYGQLHLKVQEMASSLLALGLSSTDVLLFYAENSLEYGLLVLASIYLGLPYCPAPPASGPFELTEQIKGAKASVLIFSSEKLATIEKALQGEAYSSTMRDYLKVFIQLDSAVPDPLLREHSITSGKTLRSFSQLEALGSGALLKSIPHFPVPDPATALFLVCFTSGTTGLPKAAWHTHRSFLVTMVNAKIGLSEFAYRIAIWHPLGHISGSLWLLHALDVGMTVVLFADSHLTHNSSMRL